MSINYIISKNKLFISLITLQIVLNIYLIQFPLINELSYEYSALNSFLLFLLIPFLNFFYFKKDKSFVSRFSFSVIITLVPALLILIITLLKSICSFIESLKFYFVITFISGLISFFLIETINKIFPKYGYLIYILVIVTFILIPLFELYYYPQIYFYSPLIGYFPGTIYDEDISVDSKLLFYRLINFTLVFFIYKIVKRNVYNNRVISVSVILILLIIGFLSKPLLGFSTSENELLKHLNKTLDEKNFTIYASELDSLERKNIINHVHYYYSEFEKSLSVKPLKKIKIFLFENPQQKKKLFGSENANIAKPWLYHIYLDKTNWKNSVKHEMAHIFSAEFGSSFLSLAGDFNPFLIEGFATSQDPFINNISIDYLAALHYQKTKKNLVSELYHKLNFFEFNSTLSYLYSGSYVKFLIENYGIEKFKKFYSSNDFKNVYGQEIDKVFEKYISYLQTIQIDFSDKFFNYYFARESLLQKSCTRFTAKIIKEAWQYYSEGKIEEAKNYFLRTLSQSINYQSLIGYVECLLSEDKLSESLDVLKKYQIKFINTPYEYLIKFRLADIYVRLNNLNESKVFYEEIKASNPEINLSLLSDLRLKLLEKNLIVEYVSGNDSNKLKILLRLNEDEYVYSSFPSLINLSKSLDLSYENFLSFFNKPFINFDDYSSIAFLKLSQFMVVKQDFIRAKKIAALSIRTNSKYYLKEFLEENYKMIEWFINQSKNSIK